MNQSQILNGVRQYKVPGRNCWTTFWRWLPYTIKCYAQGAWVRFK